MDMDRALPLVETGVLCAQTQDRAPDSSVPFIRQILYQFIKKNIGYQQCKSEIAKYASSTECVDRVNAILCLPETPPPFKDTATKNSGKKSVRQWTAEEDMRLIGGIYRYGIVDWAEICKFVGYGRSRSQCSQRWHRSLNPSINKDKWGTEDDFKLMQAVKTYGDHSWTKVAQFIGARTDVQCRYRYQLLSKKYPTDIGMNPGSVDTFLGQQPQIPNARIPQTITPTVMPRNKNVTQKYAQQNAQNMQPQMWDQFLPFYQAQQQQVMQPQVNPQMMHQVQPSMIPNSMSVQPHLQHAQAMSNLQDTKKHVPSPPQNHPNTKSMFHDVKVDVNFNKEPKESNKESIFGFKMDFKEADVDNFFDEMSTLFPERS